MTAKGDIALLYTLSSGVGNLIIYNQKRKKAPRADARNGDVYSQLHANTNSELGN
jgi:hypothetical protein